MSRPTRRRQSAVPSTRLGRAVRLGLMAGEVAIEGVFGSARALAAGKRPTVAGSLFSQRNAETLARRLSSLRGAAMKLGQMLSVQGDELLPPEFRQALAILRSQAYAMPIAQLRRVLGREYGAGWQDRFESFDEEPLAAASIGQVHRALTRDGRDVVLKIQYPGVARSIDSDVDNMATLLRWLNFLPVELDIAGLSAEAKRQLKVEADYLQEADHAERFHRLLEGSPGIVLPRVHRDLTTRRILALDYIESEPIESVASLDVPQHRRDALARRIEGLMFRELFDFGLMQTDPNPANYRYQPDTGQLVLLDFGSSIELDPERVDGYREVCRAVIADDIEQIRLAALRLGYLAPDTPAESAAGVIEIIRLVCQPIRHRGAYDFAASQLPLKARDLGLEVAFRQGLPTPPPATMFLHRKLVGTFMLCAMLHARIDVHRLVEPYLR
jgi:predicted unusual protein kinase regulating ubiquinone biosynthesis (AarF/ABC1/UbiB family)